MSINGLSLCRDDIHTILKSKMLSKEYKLVSYILKPFEEKVGLLGDHAVLETLVEEPLKKRQTEFSFFVKLFPSSPISAEFAEKSGAFDKEIATNRIFSKIKSSNITIVKDCIPECRLIKGNRILVFDDLKQEGFEVVDKYELFNYETISVVLKSLAKMHASSIIYEEQKSEELGKKYRLNYEYQQELEESFYIDREGFINVKGVAASIKGVLTEIDLFKFSSRLSSGKNFKTVAEKCCFKVYDAVKFTNKFRGVISHGDLWSANLLLKYDNNRVPIACKFVDFQLARYLSPSHDVMSVLHLTTSRELRKTNMNKLLDLYYSELKLHLKHAGYDINTILPFMTFLESCEEQKPFALMQTATYLQLILLTSDELKEFYADEAFCNYACYEDRSTVVLKYVDGNENYRNRLRESIQDLRDYCERL